ncbi:MULTISPECIES: hypothetical protein [unclassified Nostoc]|nr:MULTISPECIES: hypothetical protein [unclassified Nostoc]
MKTNNGKPIDKPMFGITDNTMGGNLREYWSLSLDSHLSDQ